MYMCAKANSSDSCYKASILQGNSSSVWSKFQCKSCHSFMYDVGSSVRQSHVWAIGHLANPLIPLNYILILFVMQTELSVINLISRRNSFIPRFPIILCR